MAEHTASVLKTTEPTRKKLFLLVAVPRTESRLHTKRSPKFKYYNFVCKIWLHMAPMYNTYNLYNEPKEATKPIIQD